MPCLSMFSCGAGTGVFMGRRARSLNVSFAHNGKIIRTPGCSEPVLGFRQMRWRYWKTPISRRHCAEILIQLGYHRMKRVDRAQLTEWIAGELCPGGQSINAMLEHVFLWCRDRRIYGPSRKELERVVRSQRQDYLDTWLIGASDRLSSDAVALLEA